MLQTKVAWVVLNVVCPPKRPLSLATPSTDGVLPCVRTATSCTPFFLIASRDFIFAAMQWMFASEHSALHCYFICDMQVLSIYRASRGHLPGDCTVLQINILCNHGVLVRRTTLHEAVRSFDMLHDSSSIDCQTSEGLL